MTITIQVLQPPFAATDIDALTDVLIDCVHGGASVSFIAPLPREKARAFWQRMADSAARGERRVLVARDAEGVIVGTVQLVTDLPDNQPHRADVAKMLVHRRARRQGIAQALLQALDDEARAQRRTTLVLDTVTGSDAERLYARHGWQRCGEIPLFALMPDGTPCGTTFFYRHLH